MRTLRSQAAAGFHQPAKDGAGIHTQVVCPKARLPFHHGPVSASLGPSLDLENMFLFTRRVWNETLDLDQDKPWAVQVSRGGCQRLNFPRETGWGGQGWKGWREEEGKGESLARVWAVIIKCFPNCQKSEGPEGCQENKVRVY